MIVNLIATAKVTIESREHCGAPGVTHWTYRRPDAAGESDCYNSFAEAYDAAQLDFTHYAKEW